VFGKLSSALFEFILAKNKKVIKPFLTFSTRNGVIVVWYYFLGVIAMEFFHFMQGFLSSGMLDFHYTENSKIPQNRVNMPIKYH
jgi:hypothetical protein